MTTTGSSALDAHAIRAEFPMFATPRCDDLEALPQGLRTLVAP